MLKSMTANRAGVPVEVNTDVGEDTGLVVATRPHKTFDTRTVFFKNSTYGREMAQDGKYGGTPLLLHDGTDTVAWTFSEPVGTKWEADSTDRVYADAKALKCINANVGDIMQIINNDGPGNDIDMTGNYVALTMWINVDSDWLAGDSFIVYAHVDGALVGNSVKLEDYFPYSDYDVWHWINIPLTDMGIESSSIDAFRIELDSQDGAKSPTFYVDEWYLQETGGSIEFEVRPDKGTWFYITAFQTMFVDAVSADNADSTMMHLSYDKILGVTPTTGYIYRRHSEGVVDAESVARITNILDLLSYPYSEITNQISDGTNTMITVTNRYPVGTAYVLKAEHLDKITFNIEDKFDDLLYMRISVQGYVEHRS